MPGSTSSSPGFGATVKRLLVPPPIAPAGAAHDAAVCRGRPSSGAARGARFASIASLFVIVLGACAAAPPPPPSPLPPLLFPPPPDPPRFVFERTLFGSADVQLEDRQARLRRMLTGESATGTVFSKPFDVTSCKGRVYVSDTVRRAVLVFDMAAGAFAELGRDERGALVKPLGLASDADCNLYVADATAGRVVVFDEGGAFVRAIGGAKWFGRLSHVAVDAQGDKLFAVDTGGVDSEEHRVRVFDARSGRHLHDFGNRGTGPGQFNLPRDIASGEDGLVHVVDGGNFRVQVFREDGSFVRSFGTPGQRYGQFSRPKGVAIDAAGNSYVSDAAHGNLQIFDPVGNLLMFIGDRSETLGRAKYMLPAGVHVDEDGRIYMIDQFFRKLDIYRPVHLAATDAGGDAEDAPRR